MTTTTTIGTSQDCIRNSHRCILQAIHIVISTTTTTTTDVAMLSNMANKMSNTMATTLDVELVNTTTTTMADCITHNIVFNTVGWISDDPNIPMKETLVLRSNNWELRSRSSIQSETRQCPPVNWLKDEGVLCAPKRLRAVFVKLEKFQGKLVSSSSKRGSVSSACWWQNNFRSLAWHRPRKPPTNRGCRNNKEGLRAMNKAVAATKGTTNQHGHNADLGTQ
ncbi:hypothetical protein ZEAMMB73_Zm00001d044169 [Zea mays]|uniref:Uncharacterized protein n=1 Tax=Zea mays TaxID=4577 RepID=A0A1D6NI86_MAIZE|nr:hypothetical protein ZEAMMB73_Zm00001d044169 [Zea mays]